MRRQDREVSDRKEIIEIMRKCDVCRIAFFDEEYPYILPLNFGGSYEGSDLELFFHGAKEGKKLSLIQNNPRVSFEMDCSHKLITGEKACNYTMEYESVCGNGEIVMLKDHDKVMALTHIMKQYSKGSTFEFGDNELKAITAFKLKVNQITGKRLTKS